MQLDEGKPYETKLSLVLPSKAYYFFYCRCDFTSSSIIPMILSEHIPEVRFIESHTLVAPIHNFLDLSQDKFNKNTPTQYTRQQVWCSVPVLIVISSRAGKRGGDGRIKIPNKYHQDTTMDLHSNSALILQRQIFGGYTVLVDQIISSMGYYPVHSCVFLYFIVEGLWKDLWDLVEFY